MNEKLAEAQKAAEKAGEAERQRIASDFHDGPLQSFISLQMRLEILRKLLDRDVDAGMEDLKQLQSLAQTQIRDLRAFVHSMRPVDVDGANLVATARRTAETFQKESGIPVTFMGTNTPGGPAAGDVPRSAADAARVPAQRAEARRRDARRGIDGEDRQAAWKSRWTTTATGSISPAHIRSKSWNCCAWVRSA